MLLVFDVGNTNIVMGVFNKSRLKGEWRINTNIGMTRDELGMFVSYTLSSKDLSPDKISKVVVSSVLPQIAPLINGFCQHFFNCNPHWVDAQSLGKMPTNIRTPKNWVLTGL